MWKLFKKSLLTPTATLSYPRRPEAAPKALKGKPAINMTLCNSCNACVQACPSGALRAELDCLALDLSSCIFCGLCEEICHESAIRLTNEYELAASLKSDLTQTYHSDKSAGAEADLELLAHEVKSKARSMFGRSLHIRHMDTGSCNGCDWDMSCLLNPVHDIQRLGFDFVASPRHADMLFCSGPVTYHLQAALQRTYAAMPEPKLVAAVGTCACSGGVFSGGYAVLGGVDKVLPVDVYIPGCPPRPQAMIQGILLALNRLENRI